MRIRWGRRRGTPGTRLLRGAGIALDLVGGESDVDVARAVAYHVMRPGSAAIAPTLAAAEELLAEESAYELVMAFLEDVQNLLSHRLPMFLPEEQIVELLGARSAVCWRTLGEFWAAVAAWCVDSRLPLKTSQEILSVENEQLRVLLWTGNRTLPDGSKLGLAEAVRYEKAGGGGIPGFSHVEVALRNLGSG